MGFTFLNLFGLLECVVHSELLGQFRESDLGCMLGVLLCMKLQHSVRRKNMRKNIVLKHDCQSH